jgi:hypothetical protein
VPEKIGQAQRSRLFHIDFRAQFMGWVSRQHLTARFEVGEAAATRDLALYRSLAPANLVFDSSAKVYRRAEAFRPLFEHRASRSLVALAEGIGDDLAGPVAPHLRAEHPLRLNPPDVAIVATLSRAIAQGEAVKVTYLSLTSGRTQREIVPHAFVETAARWHVRAWDRRLGRFADFVLTRIMVADPAPGPVTEEEDREGDEQWMRIVVLDLVAHPGLPHPEPVERDYGMVDGHLVVRLRAALVGYALVSWSVDASPDHALDPRRHHLWLANRPALYGVENLVLAPGFDPGS